MTDKISGMLHDEFCAGVEANSLKSSEGAAKTFVARVMNDESSIGAAVVGCWSIYAP